MQNGLQLNRDKSEALIVGTSIISAEASAVASSDSVSKYTRV